MKKIVFFNRIPIVDGFIAQMIGSTTTDITIVRTLSALREKTSCTNFDILLLNVDDRLKEIPYRSELNWQRKQKVKVIVFGQYEDQIPLLRFAGIQCFLKDEFSIQDLENAMA